ncbi:GNAT family N-acetyltransferase [Pseudomonas abietaniphila]|uniref:GNAT family N-acetyltransferase n=1 Tax=Pseudomonas abietaniphila TaxID=89065 RepID=UPI0007816AAF|nr:GNAT family N-acetyltransferase [Pseudomonas abietaniphila]
MDIIAEPHRIHLVTERLVLRPALGGDAAQIQAYNIRNRKHLQPWQPTRPPGFYAIENVIRRISFIEQERLAGRALHLLICERGSGEMIGECNFSNIVLGVFQACHLGYSLAEQAQGRGLMTEALRKAIGYVFEDLQLHRIMANYRPENERSARVLSGLGFQREGFARSYLKINGEWADHVLTALVNPDQH